MPTWKEIAQTLALLWVFLPVVITSKKLIDRKKQAPVVESPHIQSPNDWEGRSTPLPPEPEQPKEVEPKFVKWPVVASNVHEKSIYADYMNHSRDPFYHKLGRATEAHETNHGINADIRNSLYDPNGPKINAFYVGGDRGVVIEEPRMRKSAVAAFIPQSLRESRFRTYVSGQTEWDDRPLYLFDEWNAYVTGAMVNVEDIQTGRYKGEWTDGVMGAFEMGNYAVATAMAIQKHDPQYFESNKQFQDFLVWNLRRSYKTFEAGSKMEQFKWNRQDALLDRLRTAPECENMRKFLKDHLTTIWLDGKA
jgi:hypothetical protein